MSLKLVAVNTLNNFSTNPAVELFSEDVAPAHHYAHFYDNPVFWVAVSFLLVVALLAKPIFKISKQLLQKRVDGIIKQIDDAAHLKDDAQKLLAEYERKFINVDSEVNQILQKSAREVELFKKESLGKLKSEMAIKEKEAEERLKSAQNSAVSHIVNMTSDVTIAALKQVLAQKLNAEMQNKLIENSINSISKLDKAE